jgi:hypothetical protein
VNKTRDVGKKQLKKDIRTLFARCVELEKQVETLTKLLIKSEDRVNAKAHGKEQAVTPPHTGLAAEARRVKQKAEGEGQ